MFSCLRLVRSPHYVSNFYQKISFTTRWSMSATVSVEFFNFGTMHSIYATWSFYGKRGCLYLYVYLCWSYSHKYDVSYKSICLSSKTVVYLKFALELVTGWSNVVKSQPVTGWFLGNYRRTILSTMTWHQTVTQTISKFTPYKNQNRQSGLDKVRFLVIPNWLCNHVYYYEIKLLNGCTQNTVEQ